MSQFTKPIILHPLKGGKLWVVGEDLVYHVGEENSGEVITVPKHTITDFASIPWILYTFIGPPWGEYGPASLVHDILYQRNGYEPSTGKVYSRRRCDELLKEASMVLGTPEAKANIMLQAVHTFGMFAWAKHRRGYHRVSRLPTKAWQSPNDLGEVWIPNERNIGTN